MSTNDAPSTPSRPADAAPRPDDGDRSSSSTALQDRAEAAELQVDQLTRALRSRPNIDQAKGVLMAVYGIDADDAFQAMVTISQHANVKITSVASCILAGIQDVDFGTATRDELLVILSSISRTTRSQTPKSGT